jgi:hypothetical protein
MQRNRKQEQEFWLKGISSPLPLARELTVSEVREFGLRIIWPPER